MLKTIRILLAVLSLLAVTLLFLDFTGTAQSLWPWMAKIQFFPALLSVNILAIVGLIAATLLLGRVYCSVICPMGIFQDVVSWIHGRTMGKKKRRVRFRYTPGKCVRHIVLGVFLVLVAIGLFGGLAMAIAGLVEPYSAYGRIAQQIFAPAYDGANNLLADWSASRPDNYMFYKVAYVVSIPLLIVAIITLGVVGVMAWRGGRDYCNTICPVGTLLGYLSRYSLLKPVIDTSKCVKCGLCGRGCKAKCIDTKAHKIDYSRCVACMDCISICNDGAISYTWRRPKGEAAESGRRPTSTKEARELASRRGFMLASGLVVASVAFEGMAKTDGGFTPLKAKKTHERQVPVVPAGAQGLKHLRQHCTGCQLCVQSCPSKILKPTLGLDGFMQPHLDFTLGFCPTDCVVCSSVCPVGAFHVVDEVQKSSIKVGRAQVNLAACLSASEGVKCGSCASHCPAGAIMMVEAEEGNGRLMPIVNDALCIGCGACEYHCPVGTLACQEAESSAIYVEGLERHRMI
ncbi:MAG: 4Fe-4S dicluster domain-containing protein [Bacteroidales bacterium]|nr:4Fe-4S dicluster domain-containing protein [Bacteroidales bacterium]